MPLSQLCGRGRRISIFAGRFRECYVVTSKTVTAIFLGSKWRCLLLDIVLQDTLDDVMKMYPPVKLKVLVDDVTAFMEG